LASYFFKEKLLVNLPVKTITHSMRDWVVADKSKMHMSDYFIGSGEWDNILTEINTMPVLKEAKQLMEKDWDFKNTKMYLALIKRMESGNPSKKQHILLDSKEKIDDYFLRYQKLYLSIKENGFKNTLSDSRPIGIAINKDGSISKLPGGKHRYSIAYVLGLPSIMVEIRMIHREYLQKICNDYNLDFIEGILKIAQLVNKN